MSDDVRASTIANISAVKISQARWGYLGWRYREKEIVMVLVIDALSYSLLESDFVFIISIGLVADVVDKLLKVFRFTEAVR